MREFHYGTQFYLLTIEFCARNTTRVAVFTEQILNYFWWNQQNHGNSRHLVKITANGENHGNQGFRDFVIFYCP